MSAQPLVSVIMPFLNAERFIEEAIRSVMAQTYSRWELLLVDDGSQDDSTAIAKRYAMEKPKRIRYYEHSNHENHGTGISRNLGVEASKGTYLAFLDADDIWLEHKLEKQMSILCSHSEAALLYGNTRYWYSWSKEDKNGREDFEPNLGVATERVWQAPGLVPAFLAGRAAIPCMCSVVVKAHVLREVGGFEESFSGMYDDQVFYAKVALAYPVFVSATVWDYYRQHPDSCCAQAAASGDGRRYRLQYLAWLEAHLHAEGITNRDVWRALNRAQWRAKHIKLARLMRFYRKLAMRLGSD